LQNSSKDLRGNGWLGNEQLSGSSREIQVFGGIIKNPELVKI
jgi:hypothetical protein